MTNDMPQENNKIGFWGGLDSSAVTLADVAKAYSRLYTHGEFRMTWYNIERMDKYLANLAGSLAALQQITNEFRPIAAPKKCQNKTD